MVPSHLICQFFKFSCHSQGSHVPGANKDVISEPHTSQLRLGAQRQVRCLLRRVMIDPVWAEKWPSFRMACHGQYEPGGPCPSSGGQTWFGCGVFLLLEEPCEQRFLSGMAFSIFKVARVACRAVGQLRD